MKYQLLKLKGISCAILLRWYHLLYQFPFTRSQVKKITRIYENIKPAGEDTIAIETMKLIIRNGILSILAVIFCFWFRGGTIYYYMSVLALLYVIQQQMIQYSLEKEEYRLLKQLEKYLGDVRHYYHAGGIVEEAVFDSLADAEQEIARHMNRIYDILCSGEDEETEEYRDTAPNKFFTTFLALCQLTMIYGDTLQESRSLFLTNLNYLRNEIHMELLKREKIKYVFSGLVFICLMPVFFLKPIENWSISNLPELESYYYGGYGILVTIAIFMATLLSYQFINWLKGEEKILPRDHIFLERICNCKPVDSWLNGYLFRHAFRVHKLDRLLKRIGEGITVRQFLVQKYGLFLLSFFTALLVTLNIVWVTKHAAVKYTSDFKGVSMMNGTLEVEQYRKIISELAGQYKGETDRSELEDGINLDIRERYNITGDFIREELLAEIIERIAVYQSSHYHLIYAAVAALIAVIICNIPLFILECKRHFLKMSMEDEVIQFHSIIIMLMYIRRMDVETILNWLENFSEIFKSSIGECLDYYSYDEISALKRLKEQEPFLPFVRIVENLEACDRVGIEKAFDEIAGQRGYFAEKRKQDNEIMISNKGAIGKVLAYMPLILTLSLYLIIPFVLESISQLMGYINQLQGM